MRDSKNKVKRIVGWLVISTLPMACSIKDAKQQVMPNDPAKIDQELIETATISSNVADGMIEIDKSENGTLVGLLWPEFQGSTDQQIEKFGEVGKVLLGLVKKASDQKTEGFEAQNLAKELIEPFKAKGCEEFIVDTGSLTENFIYDIGDDGIVAAPLVNSSMEPPAGAVDIMSLQAPPPVEEGEQIVRVASFDKIYVWKTASEIPAGKEGLYAECTKLKDEGQETFRKGSLTEKASDNLDLIKIAINCAEIKKSGFGELSIATDEVRNDPNGNWNACRSYFRKVSTGEKEDLIPYKPQLDYDLHPNWLRTGDKDNSEGIGSAFKWWREANGEMSASLQIADFAGQRYSSLPSEYEENEAIEPVRDLVYDANTHEVTFSLKDPTTHVLYSVTAQRFLNRSRPNRTDFTGKIEAVCEEGPEKILCLKALNGKEKRLGMFVLKGLIKPIGDE